MSSFAVFKKLPKIAFLELCWYNIKVESFKPFHVQTLFLIPAQILNCNSNFWPDTHRIKIGHQFIL